MKTKILLALLVLLVSGAWQPADPEYIVTERLRMWTGQMQVYAMASRQAWLETGDENSFHLYVYFTGMADAYANSTDYAFRTFNPDWTPGTPAPR